MALYSIGATWNPGMSRYNRQIKAGLAGIKGLSFAYRLNTWGAKNGPAMIPANDFGRGYAQGSALSGVRGLASPLTWVESLFGLESAANMLADATATIAAINTTLNAAATQIQTLLVTAQGYDSATDATIQGKAQACESEAAGLTASSATLATAASNLQSQIMLAQGQTTPDSGTAQTLKAAATTLSNQVSTFSNGVSQLASDVAALQKQAQAGPSVTQGIVNTLEGDFSSSASTLTWIVGIGGLVYLLAPTFIPRLARGLRKAA